MPNRKKHQKELASTERKQMEDALRESEARFRAFMDNSPAFSWMKDAEGRFVYFSRALESHFGWRLEDYRDKTDFDIFAPELAQQFRDHDRTVLATNRPLQVTEETVRPDGSPATWLVTKFPFSTANGERLVGGVGVDITERKILQEALLRSEKLAVTGRLAATIAHEVNNPLGAAMNAIYIARTNPTRADEMLKIAERELHRAAYITQQTLGFHRDRGNYEKVTSHDVVREVLSVYATKLRSRNITVDYRHRCSTSSPKEGCPDGCKQCQKYLCVNAGELRQVISNLLANGIDALPDGGTMHIRISRSSHRVQLIMADNGHGMRTESLKRIFEPFFTTKMDFGTGLGLWVTQELVRKHNGVIKVRSSEGKGTVFRLTFPQQRSEDGALLTASSTSTAKAA